MVIKEKVSPTSHKFSQKIEKKGTFLNSFFVARITLIPKSDKDTAKQNKQKNYRPTSLNIVAKILKKILVNRIKQHINRITYHDHMGFFPGMQKWFNR